MDSGSGPARGRERPGGPGGAGDGPGWPTLSGFTRSSSSSADSLVTASGSLSDITLASRFNMVKAPLAELDGAETNDHSHLPVGTLVGTT